MSEPLQVSRRAYWELLISQGRYRPASGVEIYMNNSITFQTKLAISIVFKIASMNTFVFIILYLCYNFYRAFHLLGMHSMCLSILIIRCHSEKINVYWIFFSLQSCRLLQVYKNHIILCQRYHHSLPKNASEKMLKDYGSPRAVTIPSTCKGVKVRWRWL